MMTSKTITIRNFHCTLTQCPVVLASLKAGLVTTTVPALKLSETSILLFLIHLKAKPQVLHFISAGKLSHHAPLEMGNLHLIHYRRGKPYTSATHLGLMPHEKQWSSTTLRRRTRLWAVFSRSFQE